MIEQRAAALRQRHDSVSERAQRACERSGRDPASVTIVVVSKTHPVQDLSALYEHGVRDFGENYAQEWQQKAQQMPEDVRWHFIGKLQSNKAKLVAGQAHLVHVADRKSLLEALNKRTPRPQDVLLQVNVAADQNKGGVGMQGIYELLAHAAPLEHIRLCGLMTIPDYQADVELTRPRFSALAALLEPCRQWLEQHEFSRHLETFHELSMGMSHDFEVAIEEGATLVRVGSAIFGARG